MKHSPLPIETQFANEMDFFSDIEYRKRMMEYAPPSRFQCEVNMLSLRALHALRPLHYVDGKKPMAGSITVQPLRHQFAYGDTNAFWKVGDPYFNIYVPSLRKIALQRERFGKAGHQFARYIAFNGLHLDPDLKVAFAITHRAFGNMAIRGFGFKKADVNPLFLREAEAISPIQIAKCFGDEGVAKRAETMCIYRTINSILDQYSQNDPELSAWIEEPPYPIEDYEKPRSLLRAMLSGY